MAYRNEGPFTGRAHGAISPYRFIKLTASGWDQCAAGDTPDGISGGDSVSAGGQVLVHPINGSVQKLTAAAAITAAAVIYVAADGKASTAVDGDPVGKALTAATAAGGIISAQCYR